jgi:protein-S-isoprenylcysteine O-methyltransferase Ste14
MPFTNAIILGAAIGSLFLYAAASKFAFIAPEGIPCRMKLIAAFFLVFSVATVWVIATSQISAFQFAKGLLLYGLALWLFLSTYMANRGRALSVAFTNDAPKHLVSAGPYGYIRHPFYASYCLTWLAGACSSGSILLVGAFGCMVLLYWQAAVFEEQKFASGELAQEYSQYRAHTGMFLPRLSSSCCGLLRKYVNRERRRVVLKPAEYEELV